MAPGYNKTRCGPPVPRTACLKNESCQAKLSKADFVAGLRIQSWVAIPKVREHGLKNGRYIILLYDLIDRMRMQ